MEHSKHYQTIAGGFKTMRKDLNSLLTQFVNTQMIYFTNYKAFYKKIFDEKT
jgi:hypothetical protein